MALTVKTAAPSDERALTTLQDIKEELQMESEGSYDAIIDRLIAEATAVIESYCRRVFAKQTYTETLPGNGGVYLMVSQLPIISVVSIKENGTALDASVYIINDAEAGMIYRQTGWLWEGAYHGGLITAHPMSGSEKYVYEVEYQAGYDVPSELLPTLPSGVERAALITVKDWFLNMGRNPSVKSMKAADAQFTYNEDALPAAARILLAPFRITE